MKSQTPVLVVGAGPVGLMTAIELRRRDVAVEVIDVQRAPAGRSYALALHAATIDRFREAGLADEALEGIPVRTLRIEASPEERLELALAGDDGSRAVRVVPQARLERELLSRLETLGVEVRWSHRLAAIEERSDEVLAQVQRIESGASGFTPGVAVSMVAEGRAIRAGILVGADGHASTVRRELGIELESQRAARTFAAFDIEAPYEEEAVPTIAVAEPGTAVRWPLGNGRWRWLVEVDPSRNLTEPRFKSRHDWEPAGILPRDPARTLEDLLDRRFPWLRPPGPVQVLWSTVVSFEQALASVWGADRSWILGDAAHLGNPLGVHSMNLGVQEASMLADAITEALSSGSGEPLREFGDRGRTLWLRQCATVTASSSTPPWLRPMVDRFPACLPASGEDLPRVLGELGLV